MTTSDRPLVVSAVVADGVVGSFGLGVTAEVFGYDRTSMGLPRFDFALVAEQPGEVRSDTGIRILVGADARSRADSGRLALRRGPAAVQRDDRRCHRNHPTSISTPS